MTSILNEAGVAAAVDAYDEKRRQTHGGTEQPMSDRNKQTIMPMIAAAITAYLATVPDARAAALDEAAPELLGELKRMVDHFGTWANDRGDEASTETWAALYCARALIAKLSFKDHPHVK